MRRYSFRGNRTLPAIAFLAASAMILGGCAGSTGGSSAGAGEGGSGDGFASGASQDEVDSAVADLDPVTLVYQPVAGSPNSIMAPQAEMYKAAIEERSGGKITIDIVWGQAIAGYDEIDDALNDGRLDLAWSNRVYYRDEAPVFNAISDSLSGFPASPVVGEAVYAAVAADIGWNSSALLAEFEDSEITPLIPLVNTGDHYSICAEPGSAPTDWNGRQMRIPGVPHRQAFENLGASPVSLEYTETYEALQRGTVDCTLSAFPAVAEGSMLEVAPHISYPAEDTFPARTSGGEYAGASFSTLPLAYQQIIFDAQVVNFSGITDYVASGGAESIRQAKAAGGEIEPFDAAAEDIVAETNAEVLDSAVESGALDMDIRQRVQESNEKWSTVAEELGYEDGGSLEDLDEWYDPDKFDFRPLAERVYEDVMLPHRPR